MKRKMLCALVAALVVGFLAVSYMPIRAQNLDRKKFSQLDQLIAPEIKNDCFYTALSRLAREKSVKTILEIGSSSGEGSTEAFAKALSENPSKPILFCMEVSRNRFEKLRENYRGLPQVCCYNVSSISLEDFPREEEVVQFYESIPTKLNQIPLSTVLKWLRQDIAYLQRERVPQRGIELIKKENQIDQFDLVLIDGSEFTGRTELDLVYGAKFICLDDTRTFKNFLNRERLLKDPAYTEIESNNDLRNGYAIFERVDSSR